jgi:hypothetical protein
MQMFQLPAQVPIEVSEREAVKRKYQEKASKTLRLPGVEPGSIAWKAIILTVGLQTL